MQGFLLLPSLMLRCCCCCAVIRYEFGGFAGGLASPPPSLSLVELGLKFFEEGLAGTSNNVFVYTVTLGYFAFTIGLPPFQLLACVGAALAHARRATSWNVGCRHTAALLATYCALDIFLLAWSVLLALALGCLFLDRSCQQHTTILRFGGGGGVTRVSWRLTASHQRYRFRLAVDSLAAMSELGDLTATIGDLLCADFEPLVPDGMECFRSEGRMQAGAAWLGAATALWFLANAITFWLCVEPDDKA